MNNRKLYNIKKLMNKWVYGVVAITSIITLQIIGPFNKMDIVYSMEPTTVEHDNIAASLNHDIGIINNTKLVKINFISEFKTPPIKLSSLQKQFIGKSQVEVHVNLNAEKEDQKSVDAGHSPWKLDAAFVAQVFVSLKIYPNGIQGDFPIKYEAFKVIENNGRDAVVEVSGNKTPIRRVYLKRLVRQDNTGIWTVVGYDPVVLKQLLL